MGFECDVSPQVIWLLPNIRRKTAHAFLDYPQVSARSSAFLSRVAACGKRRDPDLRIPADELGDRKCRSCLRNVERDARRKSEREEALRKYGVKNGD